MYTPPKYKNEDWNEISSFIQANSFGILCTTDGKRPIATHIPLELMQQNGKDVLIGHISKANAQWKSFNNHSEVLAIFPGPHSYVSASWYNVETVSTWNYIAVHVYGRLKIIEEDALYRSLNHLMNKYEQHSKQPLALDDVNPEMVQRLMKGIVGFEIEITDFEANYKLSQNRNETDYHNIINELEQIDDAGSKSIAHEMKKRK